MGGIFISRILRIVPVASGLGDTVPVSVDH